MSGGSLDYVCYTLERCVNEIPDRDIRLLIADVATLMHDLEWYLSGDYGEGTWNESAEKFRKKWLRQSKNSLTEEIIDTMTKEFKLELMKMSGAYKQCKHCGHFSTIKSSTDYGQCDLHRECLDHRSQTACAEFIPGANQ